MEFMQHEKNVLKNMIHLSVGYGLCALEKLIPADVPVVFVGEKVTEKEIGFLKEIGKKACMICEIQTAELLLQNHVKIDFILLLEDDDSKLKDEELWFTIPLITTTGVDSDIIKKHKGIKIFYSSKSELESYVFRKTIGQQKLIYQYNTLMEVANKDRKSMILSIANFMSDFYTFIVGFDEELQNNIEIYEKEQCVHIQEIDVNKLKDYFNISFSAEPILDWILPLYESKEIFYKEYRELLKNLEQIVKVLDACIEQYEVLYQMSQQENVWKSDLEQIVTRLNEYTQTLESVEYISYLLNLSEKLSIKPDLRTKNNEISEVAIEAIQRYKKLQYLIKTIKVENEDKKDLFEVTRHREYKGIENVLLIGGRSQYNVLPYFVKGLKKGFQKLGVITYEYIYSEEMKERLNEIMISGYNHFQNTVGFQYIILMNGVFLISERYDEIREQYRHVFDNVHSKIIPLFVDHPFHWMDRLEFAHYAYMVLLADKNWVKYIQTQLKDIPNPIFMPLGGIEQKLIRDNFRERDNKVVFFGSFSDLEKMEEDIQQHKYADIIVKIIENLIDNPQQTIEMVVNEMEKKNSSRYTIHHIVFCTDVAKLVDMYIRQYYRQKVILEIVKAGIEIDIYGSDNVLFKNYPNVVLKDAVSIDEMLNICCNVRFVLNIQPWLKSGTQERVFNTMLCGAIAVTDETQYLIENTIDAQNILMYKLEECDKLPDKIKYYMEHEDEAERIAGCGYELAQKYHTWSNRAEELYKIMEAREKNNADY